MKKKIQLKNSKIIDKEYLLLMNKKISSKDKFFIAGSTGMVGSAIFRALKKNGYGDLSLGGNILAPNRKELDLLESKKVEEWFKQNNPSVVIIAAAKVGGILANQQKPADFILENLKIQTNLIEAAWRSNVKRLLFLGSSCIYPKFAKQPIQEESLLSGFLEKTNDSYAIAKISGIKLCQSLRAQYNFDAISLMPTNLYGPGDNYHKDDSHVMAALIKKFCDAKKNNLEEVICWGSGSPKREFLHVDDLATAAIFCLEKWDPDSQNAPVDKNGIPLDFLNIGTGEDISIKELSNIIAESTNYKGKITWDLSKPDGTPKKQLDIKRIKALGWRPQISLRQGIKETISNYLELQNKK